jgi:hypothetical protein
LIFDEFDNGLTFEMLLLHEFLTSNSESGLAEDEQSLANSALSHKSIGSFQINQSFGSECSIVKNTLVFRSDRKNDITEGCGNGARKEAERRKI